MRGSEEVFKHGDRVYYKGDGTTNGWDSGRVFQDGKIIFVRHAETLVRASRNRPMKTGMEFSTDKTLASSSRPEPESCPRATTSITVGSHQCVVVVETIGADQCETASPASADVPVAVKKNDVMQY